MNFKPLYLFFLLFGTFSSFSQDGIKMQISGTDNIDYSSGHAPYSVTSENVSDLGFSIIVSNNTGSDQNWRVIRWQESNVPATWTDAVCFGLNCFNPSTDNPWCSSDVPQNALIVANGETGSVFFHATPDNFAPASYKLYIGNDCTTFADSISIDFNYTNGLKAIDSDPAFTVSPNPSDDVVFLQGIENKQGELKIVDLRGTVLYAETMSFSSAIPTSELKNGIYYLVLEENGVLLHSEKLIIQH